MGTVDISFLRIYLKSVQIFNCITIFSKLNVYFDWTIRISLFHLIQTLNLRIGNALDKRYVTLNHSIIDNCVACGIHTEESNILLERYFTGKLAWH